MPFQLSQIKCLKAVVALCMLLLVGACSSDKGSLDSQIKKVVTSPELQNEQGLDAITSIILEHPDAYRGFLKSDGSINTEKLSKMIEKIGKETNPSFSWDINAYGGIPKKDLQLNLFLERSGSMTGYDARTTSGDFKSVLNEFINRFPRVEGVAGNIFIVNDSVYSYPGNFDQFVQEKNIFDATANLGNPSYTDFATIFEHVLQDTVPENINVLISDLIYSPIDTYSVTPAKIFAEEQSLATNIFQKHPDKCVMVVKLTGGFDGVYYPYNQLVSGLYYKGERPYYAVITGSAMAIYRLLHDKRYASFIDFATLPGYQSDYIFSKHPLTLDYYSLMPRDKNDRGGYSIYNSENLQTPGIHALKDVKGDTDNKTTFRIAADLSNIPTTDEYKLNPKNYVLTGAGATVQKIEPVTESMIDSRTRRYLEPATHLFTIEIDAEHLSPDLQISLLNSLPEWIGESGTSDDSNIFRTNFASTTFGVDKLLEGIYRAYHSASSSPNFFTMSISLK